MSNVLTSAMASLYPNSTTEGYEQFRNDSMNDSIHDSSTWNWDILCFILYTLVGGPICVIGFIANIICYSILKTDSGQKHRAATFLLQTLAVADNLFLTFSLFNMSIVRGLLPMLGAREKIMSEIMISYSTKYVVPFVYMVQPASVWITVLIALNQYIAVCRPLDANRLGSLKNTKIQVAVVVTMAIIFSLPYFFQFTLLYPEDYDTMTPPSLIPTSFGPRSVFGIVYRIVFDTIGALILPLFLLIIFNTRIIWELRKVAKWKDAIRQSGSSSENNITMVMVVIIIIFIVCNIPFLIQIVAWYTGHYGYWRDVLWALSNVFLTANSSTNFVVYYLLRKSFRHAFPRNCAAVSLMPW